MAVKSIISPSSIQWVSLQGFPHQGHNDVAPKVQALRRKVDQNSARYRGFSKGSAKGHPSQHAGIIPLLPPGVKS